MNDNNHIYLSALLEDLTTAQILTGSAAFVPPDDVRAVLSKATQVVGAIAPVAEAVLSVFSVLPTPKEGQTLLGEKRFFPFETLSLSKAFFPKKSIAGGSSKPLVEHFRQDFDKIAHLAPTAKAETLLHLLHKYLTAVPAGRDSAISLYDHAKLRAAVAVCQAQQPDAERPFLLIGGDMSGIQSFLFDIVSKNAAKNLKGRSFYLHLLNDGIVQLLLDKTGLFQANIVYASGGRFYVLAPNTDAVKKALTDVEQHINNALFEAHTIGLSVGFDFLALTEQEVKGNLLGEKWGKLQDKLRDKKKNRYNDLVLARFDQLFSPKEPGEKALRDAITNEEITDPETVIKDKQLFRIEKAIPELVRTVKEFENTPDADYVIQATQQQIMSGLFLRSKTYRVEAPPAYELTFKKDPEFNQYRRLTLPGLGVVQYLLDDVPFEAKEGIKPDKQLFINNIYKFLNKEALLSAHSINGFELYGGNDFPKSKAKAWDGKELPKTFSEMAGAYDEERGKEDDNYKNTFKEEAFKRLAILRMDVDGLGDVFSKGFGPEGTLAHFSALSRQLDWFFKGYLNTLWQEGFIENKDDKGEKYYFRDWTQIIYSGGDDLFIVGKWDCLLALAEIIRTDFKAWVCNHPGLDISGGVVLVTHKYPVMKAAEQCHEAEQAAKAHKVVLKGKPIAEKNAITVFDHPLHWDYEFRIVKELKDKIFRLVNQDSLPHSFIRSMSALYEKRQYQKAYGMTQSWRWQVAYQTVRQKVFSKEAKDFVNDVAVSIFSNQLTVGVFDEGRKPEAMTSNYTFFDLLHIAIRWAEYELRSIRDNKQLQDERT
jgi:CRISPR-associated protein Csm1